MKDLKHTGRRQVRPVKPVGRNRVKETKKPRKPLNIRRYLTWAGRLLGGGAVAALIGFGCYEAYGFASRFVMFRLNVIEVANNRRIPRSEILALAGVRAGDDLMKINLRQVGEQLEKNPWIETVKVRRYFPQTLAIEITERQPVAVINVGYLAYVDARGEVFKPLNEGDSLDYPIITGISEDDLTKDPTGSRDGLTGAVALISLLRQGDRFTLNDVSELHFDKGYGFTLFTTQGGVPVRLGPDGYGEKLGRLARIYRDLQPQLLTFEYIDLNYGDKIIVKRVFG